LEAGRQVESKIPQNLYTQTVRPAVNVLTTFPSYSGGGGERDKRSTEIKSEWTLSRLVAADDLWLKIPSSNGS
jgi:hypothetical protein